MTARYVFDTGALISAERRKERAMRFLRFVHVGRAHIGHCRRDGAVVVTGDPADFASLARHFPGVAVLRV